MALMKDDAFEPVLLPRLDDPLLEGERLEPSRAVAGAARHDDVVLRPTRRWASASA